MTKQSCDHAQLRDVPLDDAKAQTIAQQLIIESDQRFQAAMDAAIAAGLETASTSVSTAACTRAPVFVSDLTGRYRTFDDER